MLAQAAPLPEGTYLNVREALMDALEVFPGVAAVYMVLAGMTVLIAAIWWWFSRDIRNERDWLRTQNQQLVNQLLQRGKE